MVRFFCRQTRPAELERWSGLHNLPALHLWRRSALPHDGGLQPQAEAAAARAAPKEALQALGTDVGERHCLAIKCPGMQLKHAF